MPQNAPGNAGQLVGQGRRQLVLVHPFGGLCQPGAEAELLPVFGSHQDDLGSLNEQRSQILAAALRVDPLGYSNGGIVVDSDFGQNIDVAKLVNVVLTAGRAI